MVNAYGIHMELYVAPFLHTIRKYKRTIMETSWKYSILGIYETMMEYHYIYTDLTNKNDGINQTVSWKYNRQ